MAAGGVGAENEVDVEAVPVKMYDASSTSFPELMISFSCCAPMAEGHVSEGIGGRNARLRSCEPGASHSPGPIVENASRSARRETDVFAASGMTALFPAMPGNGVSRVIWYAPGPDPPTIDVTTAV